MGTRRNAVRLGLASALVLGLAASTWAADQAPSAMEGMLGKLGRGLSNIITCPLELIRTPTLVGRERGTIAGATMGLCQGLGRVVVRGGAGVIETLTFWLDHPHGYAPLVKPEFVWAHGNWSE